MRFKDEAKMRTLSLQLFVLFVVIFSLQIFYMTESFAQEIRPFFRGVRAQGMGGAGVSTVNDETALFINPAGLGKIRGPYFVLANPELEMNFDFNNAIAVNNNYGAITNPQLLLDGARRNPDKQLHGKAQILPAFVTTNFGIGLLGNYNIDAIYNAATDSMHMEYTNDYGAAIGYCFRLIEGRIKIGVSGKVINRVYVNQDIPGTTTNLLLRNIASEGTGVGWDAGVLLTAPWVFLPTIGAVVHDVGKTYFTMGNGYFYKTGLIPPPQTQSIDVSFAFFPIHSNTVRSSFTAEWRDVQNPETVDVYRRIHAGMEINFNDVLMVRGGMNQRYYTAGLEVNIAHQQIQLATYGEEIGTPTRFQEDRRFTLMYSLRF